MNFGIIVGVISEALKLINKKESLKYVDELIDIKTEIEKERSKGDGSNDAKIEALYKRADIIADAARAQLAALPRMSDS